MFRLFKKKPKTKTYEDYTYGLQELHELKDLLMARRDGDFIELFESLPYDDQAIASMYIARSDEGFYTIVEQFCNRNATHYIAHHLQAHVYIAKAWIARTGDWAKNVSQKQHEIFREWLSKADKELELAQVSNPNYPNNYSTEMFIHRSGGTDFETFQSIFQKATSIDPLHFDAHHEMSLYLAPKWYGDYESGLQFASETLKKIDGNHPLNVMMLNAHIENWIYLGFEEKEQECQEYFNQPHVIDDCMAVFEDFMHSPMNLEHPNMLDFLSCLAFVLYQMDMNRDAKEMLKMMGGHFVSYPWSQIDCETLEDAFDLL